MGGVRITVFCETEQETAHWLARVVALGLEPEGAVTDRLGVGGWMGRARLLEEWECCLLHRYDEHSLPLPWLCGKPRGHDGAGMTCGNWRPDTSRCGACGESDSQHLRDLMRFDPQCTAWQPPELARG